MKSSRQLIWRGNQVYNKKIFVINGKKKALGQIIVIDFENKVKVQNILHKNFELYKAK